MKEKGGTEKDLEKNGWPGTPSARRTVQKGQSCAGNMAESPE